MRIILRSRLASLLYDWIFSYDIPVHQEITTRLRRLRLYHDSNL